MSISHTLLLNHRNPDRRDVISPGLLDFIKQSEGFSCSAYFDNRQFSVGYGTKANSSNESIDLSGYYLTDDFSIIDKWAFPDTSIEDGQFLIIWADSDSGDSGLHASFRLNREGEEIGLYLRENETTFLVDQVTFGAQEEDVSFGRYPDGSENWSALFPSAIMRGR